MSGMDSLNEFYVHENMQLLEQLEEILLVGQSDTGKLGKEEIEEIFRAMHTIKGSSAMMGYDSLTKLTHSIEDVFDEIRNGRELSNNKWEELVDVVLVSIDFLKEEILNVQDGLLPEASIDELLERVGGLLKEESESEEKDIEQSSELEEKIEIKMPKDGEKQFYAKVSFENGCGMEGIRALGVLAMIESKCSFIKTIPENLEVECDNEIINDGFRIYLSTQEEKESIEQCIKETMFLESLEMQEVTDATELESVFNISSSSEEKFEEEIAATVEEETIVPEAKIEEIKEAIVVEEDIQHIEEESKANKEEKNEKQMKKQMMKIRQQKRIQNKRKINITHTARITT
ncbi:Hpt domain-containing protein [Paraclostridium sp. AKS46]|nr:Hpt domain-containing protein [Paraclostridium sp. AKS46]